MNESIGEIVEPKVQMEILVASTKSDENVSVPLSTITGSRLDCLSFKMEESKEDNLVLNEDKDVTKPETEEQSDIDLDKNNEENVKEDKNVTEPETEVKPDIDLDKNNDENMKEEESTAEIEPSTQLISTHTEDEEKKIEVGFNG